MTDAERALREVADANTVTVEQSPAAGPSMDQWKARARTAAPFVIAAFAAVVLTSASVFIERHGPQLIITGETCGANKKDFCFERVLKGGFPLAYIYDTAITSKPGTLNRGEDDVRRGAFLGDVLLYFATLVLGWEATRRFRARPRVRAKVAKSEKVTGIEEKPTRIIKRDKKLTPRDQRALTPRDQRAVAPTRRMTAKASASAPIVIASGDRELARHTILAELEFSRSLIRTYRQFQMQTVRFTVALYAAVLALMGLAIDSGRLLNVASYCTTLLPMLTSVLVLAFAVTEVRIRRARRYNESTISPKLEAMRETGAVPPLLEWETNADRSLTPLERGMASSLVLVIAMTLPALGGTSWHLFAGELPNSIWHPVAAAVNGIVLLGVALLAGWLSVTRASSEKSVSETDG